MYMAGLNSSGDISDIFLNQNEGSVGLITSYIFWQQGSEMHL